MAEGGSFPHSNVKESEVVQTITQPDKRNEQSDGGGSPKPVVPKKPTVPRPSKLKGSLKGDNNVNAPDSLINDLQNTSENRNDQSLLDVPVQQKQGITSQQSNAMPGANSSKLSASKDINSTETDRENSLPKTVPSQHMPAFVLPGPRSDAEYGGSDYIRVYPGDHDDTHSLSDSSSDEDVHLNAAVPPGVQHLHIHINLCFTKSKKKTGIRKTGSIALNKKSVTHTKSHSSDRNTYAFVDQVNADTKNLTKTEVMSDECPPLPPKKPLVPPKSFKAKAYRSSNAYLTIKDTKSRDESPSDSSEYEQYTWQSGQYQNKKQREEYYDVINPTEFESTENSEVYNCESYATAESSPRGEKARQVLGSHPWLFHHTENVRAEEKIKSDKEGSFVVIEEDNHCMPFTPYTILVVHDSHLKKIPVVKHKSSIQGKVRYTLAGVAVPKLKSIQDIVTCYQRIKIPGINVKLKPPD